MIGGTKYITSYIQEKNQWTTRISIKKKVVLELNQKIKYIEVFELETKKMEDIQLNKNTKVDAAITSIIGKIDYKTEDFDINPKLAKKPAKNNNKK